MNCTRTPMETYYVFARIPMTPTFRELFSDSTSDHWWHLAGEFRAESAVNACTLAAAAVNATTATATGWEAYVTPPRERALK